MKLEEELPDAMRDTVSGVRPDVAALVAGGIERGRRDSRRARIAQLVGTGAVLALVGGLAIAMPWGGSPRSADQQVAGTTRVVSPTPTAKPAPPRVRTTMQAALQLLLDQLPADGAKTGSYSAWGEPSKWFTAELIHTGKNGRSAVSVGVTFDTSVTQSSGDPCGSKVDMRDYGRCSAGPVGDDGSTLLVEKVDYPDGRKDQLWRATLTRADRFEVSVTATGTDKGAPPAFTLAELSKIAQSPVWQAKVDKAFAAAALKRFGTLPVDRPHGDLDQ